MKKLLEAAIALLQSGDTTLCDGDEITVQRNQFKALQDVVKAETNLTYGQAIPELTCDGCLQYLSRCDCPKDDEEVFEGHFILRPNKHDRYFSLCGLKTKVSPGRSLTEDDYVVLERSDSETEIRMICAEDYDLKPDDLQWI